MNLSKRDSALRYIERGWHVLPLHTIVDGKCSCNHSTCKAPGKHPRISDWGSAATIDPETVVKWWKMWPDANIGIVCGEKSGLVVMDIDDYAEAKPYLDAHDIPATLSQRTGSGGRHIIFKHPGGKIVSAIKPVPGIDSRADGSYIVAPPSNHVTGGVYEWLNFLEPSACPDWWISSIAERKSKGSAHGGDGEKIAEGGRNSALASFAGTLRKHGAGYETLKVALIAYNRENCVPPLDDKEVDVIARSISHYEVKTDEEREQEEHGDAIVKALVYNDNIQRAAEMVAEDVEEAGPPPQNLVPTKGLLKDIYDHVMSISRKNQPLAAMGAALSIVSVLMNRKFASHTGLRANIFVATLIPSGQGKDVVVGAIPDLLARAGAHDFIGGEPVSGAAIISALAEVPVRCYALDEYGRYLAGINNKNANPVKMEIADVLTRVWSASNKLFSGKEYSNRKVNKQAHISCPYVVVNGVTVPERFWDSISSSDAQDGFLGRYIVLDSPDYAETLFPEFGEPRAELIDALKRLHEYAPEGGDLKNIFAPEIIIKPAILKPAWDAAEIWNKLAEKYSLLAFKDKEFASIHNRVAENTLKLAMIYTVAMDMEAKELSLESINWGAELAIWSAKTIKDKIKRCVSDSENEKLAKEIIAYIEDAGPEGIPNSVLVRRKGLQKGRAQWTDLMEQIAASGAIAHLEKKDSTPGRPSFRWYSSKYAK